MPGVASGDTVTVWGKELPLGSPAQGEVEVHLRPENVHFTTASGIGVVGATVEESTFLGSIRRTVVRTESGELVRLQHEARIRPAFGERVWIGVDDAPVAARARA